MANENIEQISVQMVIAARVAVQEWKSNPFQMTEETRTNIKSWPEWAIAARHKDSRQFGSIHLTNPENPEGSFSIRTEYDCFEIPQDFWLIQLASKSFMLMKDHLFQTGFIPAEEETKSTTKSKTAASEKKVEEVAAS